MAVTMSDTRLHMHACLHALAGRSDDATNSSHVGFNRLERHLRLRVGRERAPESGAGDGRHPSLASVSATAGGPRHDRAR